MVELAIVIIIIGLLIGGILKGQELVANARIAATITQIKAIAASMSTFQDKYGALPGDMPNATARLPNCPVTNDCGQWPGNGDGQIKSALLDPFAGAPATETLAFFPQLAAADLITGVNPGLGLTWGGDFPAASMAGGFNVGYFGVQGKAPFTALIPANIVHWGHYLVIHKTPSHCCGYRHDAQPSLSY